MENNALQQQQTPESGRPPKRVSQACEACRRKKSRCPGEKPACSLCTRLKQTCIYADDGSMPEIRSAAIERRMNARFSELENRLESLLKAIPGTPPTILPRTPLESHADSSRPSPSVVPTSRRRSLDIPDGTTPSGLQIPQEPSRLEVAVPILLRKWNCQPIPLFHPNLEKDYMSRGSELQFAILAMAGRLNARGQEVDDWCEANAHRARELALGRVLAGDVRLSTIQAFVLLSFLDFTNDNGQRSHLFLVNAISLAQTSGLLDPQVVINNSVELEERRRCFWSIAIMENMFNLQTLTLGAKSITYHASFKPVSPNATSKGELVSPSSQNIVADGPVPGIIINTLPMFDIFKKAAKYVTDTKNGVLPHPPWQQQSDYAAIQAELLELESNFYPEYRFDRTKMTQHSKDAIEQNWAFWSCWLVNQFMYHTIHMLLNHPFLISLRIAAAGRCPRTFSQSSSDQVVVHSNWIIRLLDLLEEKEVNISDPFVAYCISVANTVFIHYRNAEIQSLRQNAEKGLFKGRQELGELSCLLKNVERMRKALDRLEAMDTSRRSTSPQPSASSGTKQDLLWDILIFHSPSRSLTSTSSLFSPSFAIPSNDTLTRDATSMIRPTPSTVQNITPADGFHTSTGPSSFARPSLPTPATATSNSLAAAVGTPQQPTFMPGVAQFPATPADPNYMAFNDQNLAAITEFLDQNSGRMFNEWWDFGDL
ncbi:hypothetical protein D6D10_03596 [Aureobasidium pullulans]|uniref:Zn(2)-C6 fungal-type domain-containing protein n=1 Tax=Aureobasidium pullulans TaxID=5580 RepID=A0A4S9EZE9_AURPU|nr:hypothetical protein D6D10_03596 [Aureobasidium pullulans]